MKNKTAQLKIKRGDTVRILAGKDRGKKGTITAVLRPEGRVVVEGINIVKKHVRARRAGEKGQRVSVAAPIHISNVQLICPHTNQGTRISVSRENGQRQRVSKKAGKALP